MPLARAAERVGRAGNRLAGDVQHTVDVEENCRHDRFRVYSGHEERRAPRSEIELRTLAVERTGGQHAQKSETRVEAVFDVEASSALSDAQKRRVVAECGPVLRAIAQDERSQRRNKELATERLVEPLREALRVAARAGADEAVAASRQRRLDEKKRRGETKRLRRDIG